MRDKFGFGSVKISHKIEPPIGYGFGTSGSGALGTAIALSDLFGLNLSLTQVSAFAHIAEVESVTGLGTVISLASGVGAMGLRYRTRECIRLVEWIRFSQIIRNTH